MYFQNYGLAEKTLHKYLKSAISQDPSTSNMVKSPKHLSNYEAATFIILIDQRSGY